MSKINQQKGANSNKIHTIHQQFALVFVTNYTYNVHCCKYSFVTHQRDYIRLFQLKVAFFQNHLITDIFIYHGLLTMYF